MTHGRWSVAGRWVVVLYYVVGFHSYCLSNVVSRTVCILLYDHEVKDLLDVQKKLLSLAESSSEANIFLGLIEYELNSLLGASHHVDYISRHTRFDLERYLLNM